MKRKYNENDDSIIVAEIQTLHHEKRTALKFVRTGIAMITIQVSLLGLMAIPLSSHADSVQYRIVPLSAVNLIFFLLSAYCVVYPLIHIHCLDQKISKFKQSRIFKSLFFKRTAHFGAEIFTWLKRFYISQLRLTDRSCDWFFHYVCVTPYTLVIFPTLLVP
jgi:hypothetical protein